MNGIDPNKRYSISGDILARLIAYMQTRPFAEVAQGIAALSVDVAEVAEPAGDAEPSHD